MKIIKNIFIVLSAIFVLFIMLTIFLFSESADFFEKNQAFVEQFSFDLAERWKIEGVHSRVSNGRLLY